MNILKTYQSLFVFFLTLLLLAGGCSREKSTFTHRAYHNTTARYNAYFNGREINKSALASLESSHTDDFSEILPLFIYGTEESVQAISEDMEEVIKKCSKVIERHSIYLKKKEYNRWIDDSYMLIGKARFYKREYFGALEIFEYVDRAFKDEPIRVEALTWIARTYMQLENELKAILTLEKIDKIKNTSLEFEAEFNAVYADYFMKQKKYAEAIPRLEKAVVMTKGRKDRIRMVYILAQLYQNQGDYANATRYYTEVIKLKPDYVMDFNARINRALAYDVTANNSEQIKKELNRMLKDKKNKEFYDQIYYALAELAFSEREDSLGISYLQKSASSSINNTKQKSLAYLRLGNIFFDRTDYVKAQAYYDSTSTILDQGHPQYELVMNRLSGLTRLVDNIKVIQNEDSLQRLANMGEKEREKIIYRIIREIEEEEERKRQELETSFTNNFATGNDRADGQTVGKWYFYNQTAKSVGVTEFFSVWGNRKLEDDWRRSNKQSASFGSGAPGGAKIDSSAASGLTNKDLEFYLNQLPLTDSAKQKSHNKIIEALFNLGIIYKEDFTDYEKSNLNFERLISDYDTCRYAVTTYYYLYRNYLTLDNQERARYYRDLILNKYPFTEYARLIKNPSYAKQRRDLTEKIEAFYGATYQLYTYRQYRDVIESCKTAEELFGDNFLKPKFDMLKALALGKLDLRQEFIQALQDVVTNHPTDEVKERAQEILNKISKEPSTNPLLPKVEFDSNIDGEQVFVLILPEETADANKVKISITDFNTSNFSESKLKVSSVVLDSERQMISVKDFQTKEEGLNYYNSFKFDKKKLSEINTKNLDSFIISKDNLALLYQSKNVEDYNEFFKKNYLSQ